MTVFEKNQYKLLTLSSVIWLPIILILSPAMSPGLFVILIALGAWFSKGSVEISYYYRTNFEQPHLSWSQWLLAAIIVPVWFWCLNYRKPY